MNPVSSRPTAMLRLAAGSARALLWLLLTSWCLVALSWGLLHWVIVPRIGNWKPELEQAATQALGLRVEIGALQAESTSLLPRLTLRELRLFDPQGREALYLPSVLGTLSLRSLLSLGFEQLVIDGPELELRRRTDGVVTLAGIALASRSGPSDAADWFFSQREFLLRDGLLRWSDELRPQAAPLELREVSLLVRNPGRQHQLRLDATPPADWGARFSLRGRFRQPLLSLAGAGELKDWSGQLYGDFSELRLQPLRQYLDPGLLQQLELQDGEGSLAFWSELSRGQWTGFTGDLALRRLALRLAPELKPLKLQQLGGRLELRQENGELEIATRNLAFRTDQGTTWPGGNLRYRETRDQTGALRARRFEGDRLDLLALRQLAEQLPLPTQGRHWLDQLQPAGLIEQLELQWQAGTQPQGRWQAKGQVSGLSLQAGSASDGRPGLSGASLDFDASDSGGQASLELERGALDFPGLFEQPRLEFDRLQTELQWTVDGDRIQVEVPQLSFANADAAGQAKGHWQTSDPASSQARSRFPGRLELDATLSRADGTRVHRYLPLGVNAEARHYVRDAIRRGQSRSAQFKVRGELADFPFSRPGSGEFSVRASVSGVELDYVPAMRHADGRPDWPALNQVDGELQIDGNSLAIVKGRAQVAELPQLRASQVEARIPDLAHAPQLQIKGQIAGPAADALAFVNRSPLLGMTGRALAQARIDGQTQVQLRLDLPLERIETSRVEGLVQFPGNDMQFTPDTPALAGTSGSLRFSEQGFNVPQARTQLLGGELVFQGGMTPGQGALISFNGQGSASAQGLRQAGQWQALAALGQIASGSTAYQVQLEFQGAATALTVSSNLQGLALALPAPLGKTAAESLPMRYEVAPQAPGNGRWRDLLSLDLGPAAKPIVSARYEREHEGEQTRVLRGALALGTERPALPARGVQAQLAFDRLSLEDWQDAFDVAQAAPGPADPASGAIGAVGAANATGLASDSRAYWPGSLALRARQIDHEGRSFHDLELKGQLERNSWRGTIAARQLKGRVEYQPADADSPGRVYARLEHLMLPHSAASEIEQLTQQAPVRLPALDIVVQDFELGSRKLGRLEIEAVNQQPSPTQREAGSIWRLEKLNLSSPEARLQASGHWAIAAAPRGVTGTASTAGAAVQRRTALQLKLEIEDAGALLARLGMPGVVRGGQGSLTGQVAWLGSPLALHPPSLNGALQLALERGQFLQADPGLAKLLGVLSLQALPRRLTLDFRDIFSEGFAFDSVRGSARIAQGVISSDNLQMRGVNAVVFLDGSADLGQETQDISALVIPELNAGGASLIASLVNPAVGLGSFVAQYLIGKPLRAAATQQFHVSGSWYDPKVEKVEPGAAKLPEKTQGEPP